MTKVLRLTESDLVKLVTRVINEQSLSDDIKQKINQIVVSEGKKVKNYYIQHYSKSETISKFKNKRNLDIVKKYIPTIRYRLFLEKSGKNGFVTNRNPGVINLNVNNLFTKSSNGDVTLKGSLLYDTILHEMAHSIDLKLQSLGERTISTSDGYYNVSGGKDEYVDSDMETFARVQRLREVLGLNPNANGEEIKRKLIDFIKSKRIVFPNIRVSNANGGLVFTSDDTSKGALSELWRFYSPMKINNTSVPDIAALFGKFSAFQTNGSVFLNLDMIGKVNVSTKGFKFD